MMSYGTKGSTMVVTLITLVAVSLMAAYTLTRVTPRVRMAYQNAAWQEARVAAEAGVDSAMNDLLLNATGFSPNKWTGWQPGPAAPAPVQIIPGVTLPGTPLSPLLQTTTSLLTDVIAAVVYKKNGKVKKPKDSSGDDDGEDGSQGKSESTDPVDAVVSSGSMYLDNVRVSAAAGLPAEVNVQLWALEPSANPHTRWYRIRSMGTCPLPPMAYESPAENDAMLRRFSLHTVRPSLKKDDAGSASTIPLPNISRTVEVLVEPILCFELGLWTADSLSLPATGSWRIDSFDSSDTTKSNAGAYPGLGGTGVQANGDVASGAGHTFDQLYAPTIALNGTHVLGAIATNGGDDPATQTHENVTGAGDQELIRLRDDFSRQMIPITRPPGEFLPPPLIGSYLVGTTDAPTIYSVHGSLTQLKIASPGADTTGAIVVMIDGDLNLAGPLIIPPSVIAVIYVRGNVTFRANVNSGPWNSNLAGQLLLFADAAGPQRQTVQALGPISICAALYGPQADVSMDGAVNWSGCVAAGSFKVLTGGDGGLHYDEALSTIGATVGFRIVRYIEDVRE